MRGSALLLAFCLIGTTLMALASSPVRAGDTRHPHPPRKTARKRVPPTPQSPPSEPSFDAPAATAPAVAPRGTFAAISANAVSCGGTTTSFTNTTPAVIPAPGVLTSTILVSGVDPYLLDLNARTFIAHTMNGHLQVTLQSPAGTVSTLTSNNAGMLANVYDGTVWDDQANPGGQVPYGSNPGLVTDHPYADGVVATPLVPEEAMGAFIGENPNGVWTLTVADTCTEDPPLDTCLLDAGAISRWSLEVTTLPAAPASRTVRFSNINTTTIPFGPAVVTTTIPVSGMGSFLGNLQMRTFISYPINMDLDVTLTSPAGTVVTITTDNGDSVNDGFDGTNWFDKADPGGQVPYVNEAALVTDRAFARNRPAPVLVPEEAMAAFNGEDPNGVWTLTISVDTAGNRGSIDDWELLVTTLDVAGGDCTMTCPGDITVHADPGVCDAVVNYPPPEAGPCCGTVTCTEVSGSPFPPGRTTVVCTSAGGDSCSFSVTVETNPPVVDLTANSTLLWPPNHSLINVGLAGSASDPCNPNTPVRVAVFGDEDDEMATGDGNFSPDAKNIALQTLVLRSERQGDDDGRVYLVIGTAGDPSSPGFNCVTVVVPHSQSQAAINSVQAQAAAARAYCLSHGMAPPGYYVVGDGPVIGPKQTAGGPGAH